MKRGIVFSAGPSDCKWIEEIRQESMIICADAGYLKAEKHGIKPDIIIGDFDSSDAPMGNMVIFADKQKDDTDTMLAVKKGLESGCNEICIIGGFGGRFDHTFANLAAIEYIKNHNSKGWMISDDTVLTIIKNEEFSFHADKGTIVSVFAWGEESKGVCLKGLKYPLFNANISTDFPIGVSNEVIQENVSVSVKKGFLLIIITPIGNTFIKSVYNKV